MGAYPGADAVSIALNLHFLHSELWLSCIALFSDRKDTGLYGLANGMRTCLLAERPLSNPLKMGRSRVSADDRDCQWAWVVDITISDQ